MGNITRLCVARAKRECARLIHNHGSPTMKEVQRCKASLNRLEYELLKFPQKESTQ
jgi:hypothetical protein